MKRAVVAMLALALGGMAFQAHAQGVSGVESVVPGGDPGVFKPHEMELLINKVTGGVWVVTGEPMPNTVIAPIGPINFNSKGNGWAAFSIRDLSGDSILDVSVLTIPGVGTFKTYNGFTPEGMQQLNVDPAYMGFGIPSSKPGVDFSDANPDVHMDPFQTSDPDVKANPFKGKLSFFLGNIFTPKGAAFDTYNPADLRLEWAGRAGTFPNGVIYGNLGQNMTGAPDVTFFGTPAAPIPEPATMALLGMGGLALLRRRAAKA